MVIAREIDYLVEPIMKNIFKKVKFHILKIYYARGTAHEIALGAAIGAFWGVFPTFGLSTVLSLLLYRIFRFNIVVAISAAFISNPFTSPFLLFISYKVGSFFRLSPAKFELEKWDENLSRFGWVMLTGSTIVSTVVGCVIYFVTKYVVEHREKVKLKKSTSKP
jgi:uncharacterized protein (DUF2062 family)